MKVLRGITLASCDPRTSDREKGKRGRRRIMWLISMHQTDLFFLKRNTVLCLPYIEGHLQIKGLFFHFALNPLSNFSNLLALI
jgi:hypothetical protein